jgi:hypothetical protein
VTTVSAAGAVLTGPMTGCYICKYTEANHQYLAHIGTKGSPDSKESIAVKEAFLVFVAGHTQGNVTGVNPMDSFTVKEITDAQKGAGGAWRVCGYFDGGLAWSILLAPTKRTSLGDRFVWKVAGVKAMNMQPLGTIKALASPRPSAG